MDFNPLRNMRKLKTPPRDRYVTNDEYLRVWHLATPMVQCVMDLAMLTGLILFEWNPSLRSVVQKALSLKPQVRQHIACNRKGKAYTKNGFDSVSQRLMAKATGGEDAIEHFQFRDLRRKSATDEGDVRTAQVRLGHSSSRVTKQDLQSKARQSSAAEVTEILPRTANITVAGENPLSQPPLSG